MAYGEDARASRRLSGANTPVRGGAHMAAAAQCYLLFSLVSSPMRAISSSLRACSLASF